MLYDKRMRGQFVLLGAIVVYLVIIAIVMYIHSDAMFNRNGSYKEFGVGVEGRTVFPIWLIAVMAAPVSYAISLHLDKRFQQTVA
jgi:hypothetical protein